MKIKKSNVIEWGTYDKNDNFIDPVFSSEITHYKLTYEDNGAVKTVVIDKYNPPKRKINYEVVMTTYFKDDIEII